MFSPKTLVDGVFDGITYMVLTELLCSAVSLMTDERGGMKED